MLVRGAKHLGLPQRCARRPYISPSTPCLSHHDQPNPSGPPRRRYTRPSIAPKPALDIRSIAKAPGLYEQNCLDRNYGGQSRNSWEILRLTERRAELQRAVNRQREQNNALQKQIGDLQGRRPGGRRDGEGPEEKEGLKDAGLEGMLAKARLFKEEIARVAEEERQIEEDIMDLALALPNLSSLHTPNGDAFEVVEVVEPSDDARLRYHSRPAAECLNSSSLSHVDIGAQLDLLDFAGSAKTSGWGWYCLRNEGAMLEQALVQYSLSLLRRRGFTLISPPSVVYSHIAAACGFQPRDQHGEQQSYALQQPERDKGKPPLSLAATAEIPLAGIHAGRTFAEEELPLRTAAVSRCYRAEAGARGVDTKGLYRVHEFTKVEMFAWTAPARVDDEEGFFDTEAVAGASGAGGQDYAPSAAPEKDMFDEMLEIQREILSSLGLTFRVLEMPAGDLGGPASRKRDMEVFFPSRRDKDGGWGEVTSTSACTDYQSRRLAAKVKFRDARRRPAWPYTFNGTALAVPRVLAAIMETHYDPRTQSIAVPAVLRRWMDTDVIRRQ